MTEMNIAGHDIVVERSKGGENFELKITLEDDNTDADYVKTLTRGINAHLGPDAMRTKYARSRSDITMDHVEEAASYIISEYELEHNVEVRRIVNVEVIAKQAIRKTPYSEQKWNND